MSSAASSRWNGPLQVAVSGAACLLVAVAAGAGTSLLAAAVVALALTVAVGWPGLLPLPAPRGSSLVIALAGVAGAVAAAVSAGTARPLQPLAVVLAGSLLLAFGHEILRGEGRTELVDSVTGTFGGQLLALVGSGWLLVPHTGLGTGGVVLAAAAAFVARVAVLLPVPLRMALWLAMAASALVSALASLGLSEVDVVPAAVLGAGVGAVVLTTHAVLAYRPASPGLSAALAAGAAPIAAAGTAAYAAARLLGA